MGTVLKMLMAASEACSRRRKAEGDATASSFGAALADYLAALRLPAQAAEHARALVREHDFSSARAHLIPSVPGYHTGGASMCLCTPAALKLQRSSQEDVLLSIGGANYIAVAQDDAL